MRVTRKFVSQKEPSDICRSTRQNAAPQVQIAAFFLPLAAANATVSDAAALPLFLPNTYPVTAGARTDTRPSAQVVLLVT